MIFRVVLYHGQSVTSGRKNWALFSNSRADKAEYKRRNLLLNKLLQSDNHRLSVRNNDQYFLISPICPSFQTHKTFLDHQLSFSCEINYSLFAENEGN